MSRITLHSTTFLCHVETCKPEIHQLSQFKGRYFTASPAFAAQRQVFHSQAPSIQPVPMAETTTGLSHQNTAHLQSSQSALIPPYQAPFVPFTYGMPPTFSQAYIFQYPSTLRQILPKPQMMADSQSSSSTSRPPDFITHVQSIRKSLYQLCGVDEAQEPPWEGQVAKVGDSTRKTSKHTAFQYVKSRPWVFSLRIKKNNWRRPWNLLYCIFLAPISLIWIYYFYIICSIICLTT